MNTAMHSSRRSCRRSESGMTLMEIIVAVSLLVLIVTALLGAFNQTTRAFKTGFNQTDVLESGRAATEMVTRVVSDLSPSGQGNTNLLAFSLLSTLQTADNGVVLDLSSSAPRRRLFMQKLLLLHRNEQEWVRSAFLVGHLDTNNPSLWNSPEDVVIGSLYRYQVSVRSAVTNREYLGNDLANLLLEPRNTQIGAIDPRRFSKIIDGVVHFSIRTSNVGAEWIDSGRVTNLVSEIDVYRRLPGYEPLGRWSRILDPGTGAESDIYTGAMLPSYVEIEIGLLEQEALSQIRALLADKVSTSQFLVRNAQRIHFFRQRVPIRLGVNL